MATLHHNNFFHRRRSASAKEKQWKSISTATQLEGPPTSSFSLFKTRSKKASTHESPAAKKDVNVPSEQSLEGDTVVGDRSSESQAAESSSSPSPSQIESVLDDSALLAPCAYIQSLPSKDVRSKLVDAFNIWLQVPQDLTPVIKDVVSDLHNASLILDDIQDDSLLRRGSPATHCIFGDAQSINSATYMLMNTAMRVQQGQPLNRAAMDALLKGMRELFVGQSWELKWKFHTHCPSVAEYMAMIDGKTGAMFKLLVSLMHSMSPRRSLLSLAGFDRFVALLGRLFQVRDDYINLQDEAYSEQKGFCEDLDEGKLSYPVVACCRADGAARDAILGIFRQKAVSGIALSRNTKIHILGLMKRSGAFEETWQLLQSLHLELREALASLEEAMGGGNPGLQKIISLLSEMQAPKKLL